jgi:glycosyltransferase involved in cell wall biosynthesis
MVVHQLLARFVDGDAIAEAALLYQVALRRIGAWGEIYAAERAREMASLTRPAEALQPGPNDWVLYHHGPASPLAGAFAHLPCQRGIVFHDTRPDDERSGSQLAALAPHIDTGLAATQFLAEKLRAAGVADPRIAPLFVEPRRFAPERADSAMSERLAGPGPTLLHVGRGDPDERIEDLLALHSELRRLEPGARLLLVTPRRPPRSVGVQWLEPRSHGERVAAFRSATAFASMSERSFDTVPVLEAMAADLPVVAFASGAVPETLGGAGIAFTEKRFAFLAELVRELHRDGALRERVIRGQQRRLATVSPAATEQALRHALGRSKASSHVSRRGARRRPRVALIVQRYGEAIGGAEAHARSVAHRLCEHWDLTVLTTCAKDHLTWANHWPAGETHDGSVRVLRFPSERTRTMFRFNALSRRIFGHSNDRPHEERWLAEQGPLVPGLLRHLAEERSYDGYLAFTYLYLPTAWGLPLIADRALVIPTAHDEPALELDVFADVFERPRALLCNTPEEEQLIRARFPACARTRVVGVGIDAPRGLAARFRERFAIERPYLLYVGRIEPGKDIPELLRFHAALGSDGPDLLLAGARHMRVGGRRVRHLGQVNDADKFDAIAGAEAVVVPSRFESLSLLSLEAFSQGTPVVANGRSAVLAGQCQRSGAGLTYEDAGTFASAVRHAREARRQLGQRGRAFAREHRWSNVIQAYLEEMGRIVGRR